MVKMIFLLTFGFPFFLIQKFSSIFSYKITNNCTKSIYTNHSSNNRNNSKNDNDNDNIYDIIILGAGIAGLGAGYCLKQYQQQQQQKCNNENLKFIILEAQNYIGGRVRTVKMHNYSKFKDESSGNHENHDNVNVDDDDDDFKNYIDSGAQWLHDDKNQFYQIANNHNLLATELSEEGLGSFICDNGTILQDDFCKKINFKIGQILEECEKFVEINYNNDDDSDKTMESLLLLKKYPTIEKYLKFRFYEYLNDKNNEYLYDMEKFNNALKLLDWNERFQTIDNSCLNLNQLSTKLWGMYSLATEKNDQAHINFKNGFQSIIYNALVNFINLKNIQLNCEISSVIWDILSSARCNKSMKNQNGIENDIVRNHNENMKNLICIQTNTKRCYYAKHIICTFSLGVLKLNEHKLFIPKLPNSLRNAIHSFGYETINKIFLQFNEEWWSPMKGIQLLFNDSDYKNCKWTRYLSGFDILYPGSPNTLLGWVGSQGAIEMEQLTDAEIIQDCIDILTKFTKRKVPHPIRYFFSRWNSNKFIRGGYSFLSTKCEELNITGKDLSIPVTLNDLETPIKNGELKNIEDLKNLKINNGHYSDNEINDDDYDKMSGNYSSDYPLILFAGEACHEKYFSTAHGAFESGYEQAQKLLKFYSSYKTQ